MFRFGRRKAARNGIRAGLLAGAVVVAFGVGGIGPSAAMAAPSCTGADITGAGASFQAEAQKFWISDFEGGVCPVGEPEVKYESIGSGGGLNRWCQAGKEGEKINLGTSFVSTDDAPTPTQISNMSKCAGGSPLLVIPVTQAAIGIVVNPPPGCTVTKLLNKDVSKLFAGKLKNWVELKTEVGTCNAPVTRVVRLDSSGTTYQFKNYLYKLNQVPLKCTVGPVSWKDLFATGTPNTTWPEDGVGNCEGKVGKVSKLVKPKASGNDDVVMEVGKIDGSIGYGSLADIETFGTPGVTNGVAVQSNGFAKPGEATYGDVGTEFDTSNCAGSIYTIPKEGRAGKSNLNVDWSEVLGSNPSIGGNNYPICTITYSIALKGYGAAGFTFGQYQSVFDYLAEYVVKGGQEALVGSGKWYAPLPSSKLSTNDVLGAAESAASKIAP